MIRAAYLMLAGLIGAGLGTMILFAPVPFYAGYDIDPGGQVNLLNELRSHGLSLLGAGIFIASGAFLSRLASAATIVATGLYLGYGVSRLVAIALDGLPSWGLLGAGAVELALGLAGLGLLLRSRAAT
ncbi:hypothetical protein FF80_00198 [Devosia sp. LC5]|uniref:DUF4345 domain-containing protein n=1 Tax=Devosia sp. LC5 TaxID=1502724 RepID=UPI0004E32EBC|nr:DUF4345 domain-containing protein [Devosia sp. LC5]KFC72443.1 hypothetical protein FF80_00198 [Devosia sp. LC5]